MRHARLIVTGAALLTLVAVLGGPSAVAMTRSSVLKFAPGAQAAPQTAKPATSQAPAAPSRPPEGRGLGPVPGVGASGPPSPRNDFSPWWKDAGIIKELGLTPVQASNIDKIYEKRLKQIQLQVAEYDNQKADLDRMYSERVAPPAAIELQASKMMTPKVAIDISRVRMLYEMSLVMSPQQNEKLKDIADRFYREQRERGRGRNPAAQ
jgi:Spy/CpxP family protein refolding chaperone